MQGGLWVKIHRVWRTTRFQLRPVKRHEDGRASVPFPKHLCRPVELAPDHRDLPPYGAFVRRAVIISLLEPIQHFAHELGLCRWKSLNEDSPRERHEERIPIVAGRCAWSRWSPAQSLRFLRITALVKPMRSLKA